MGISVIYFNIFQYNRAVEQRRIDPVVRAGPKSVLTLPSFGAVSPALLGSLADRWARRHAAPAVVGRFIFFRDLAFFSDSDDSGFEDTTDERRTKPG